MIIASELRAGVVLRFEHEFHRVLDANYQVGGGKLAGAVHAKLLNLRTHTAIERRFRPEEKLDDVALDRGRWQYLYADGDEFVFMNPDNFEQVPIARALLGPAAAFLQPEMMATVESFEGRPVQVTLPEAVELHVVETAEPTHQRESSALKSAKLDNGMEVLVPMFIKSGDAIRVDTTSGKYLERARGK
jgi:elongation factor P